MKEKVLQFKGIYTNASEVNIPLEYCKDTNGKITTIGLEAKVSELELIRPQKIDSTGKVIDDEIVNNILYFEYITLDNDRNGITLINGEYKSNYEYNLEHYYCIITEGLIALYDQNWIKYLEYTFEGDFKKALTFDNKLYLFTTKYSYELAKYNRKTNRNYTTNVIPDPNIPGKVIAKTDFYKEVGIFLKPFTYEKKNNDLIRMGYTTSIEDNTLGLEVELERIKDGTKITQTVKYIFSESYIHKDQYEILILNLVNTTTDLVVNRIWFTNYYDLPTGIPLELKEALKEHYYLLPPNTTADNFKTYAEFYLENYDSQGLINSWLKDYNLVQLSKIWGWTRSDIVETLIDKEETLKQPYQIDEVNGFSSELYDTYYLASYLLDDGSEIPIAKDKLGANTLGTNYYGYNLSVTFPYNLTTKVLAFRLYIKNKQNDLYEMIYHYSFFDSKSFQTILTKNDLSGIYINQTIGVNDPFDEKILTTFENAVFVDGILFTQVGNNIYYPVIGNGFVTKLYMLYNVIPKVYGINLFNMNGSLAVSSSDRIQIIHINNQGGILLFSLKDELGMKINDYRDVVETPDGLILNTSKGIYVTDGQGLNLLSEAINNIIIENWKNSDIFYDSLNKELWYVAHNIRKIYKYLFEVGAWISSEYYLIDRLLIDVNNNIYISNGINLYKLNEVPSAIYYKGLLTNLGYMGIYKTITHINFDFSGKLEWESDSAITIGRQTKTLYRPLKYRYLKDYEAWQFKLKAGSILYGFEVNFEVIKKLNEYTE